MTTDAVAGALPARRGARLGLAASLPVADRPGGAASLVWYAAAVWLNAPQVDRRGSNRGGRLDRVASWSHGTWALERPVLPAPHQVAVEL